MSRVHDALRRSDPSAFNPPVRPVTAPAADLAVAPPPQPTGMVQQIEVIAFTPSPEAPLVHASRPTEPPAEEFRSLRTRLNHLQTLQAIHTIVVSSASPDEGKSLTAANLALVQSHLEGNLTLLCDFDLRNPSVHTLFQIPRGPGVTELLQGKAQLYEVIRRIEKTNLYIMPAGEAVPDPLELLNLPELPKLVDQLPTMFNWVIFDSPSLLTATDANLLSTVADGLLMVVRLGKTHVDAVARAMVSLRQSNVLGVVVNGASRNDVYAKTSYHRS